LKNSDHFNAYRLNHPDISSGREYFLWIASNASLPVTDTEYDFGGEWQVAQQISEDCCFTALFRKGG
jgi:hypothetical protein